ncbi:hypothetical protein [Methanoregula sp.]|uniref:hypothetical protein n=1 Tax=Methanoregula sp. TaxID=2052170 RepID=UPI000CC0DF4C|nr:hypothetical protein [Methanoregula sp.]PKG31108.1 MAG: SAM-dependent methyltransferase [Methanoregula sp.]
MFSLERVVPWGRSFREYLLFFRLTDNDLKKRILGCADGPAGFNAGLTAEGGSVVSCDPLYQYTEEEIRSRIAACRPEILEQVSKNRHLFVWNTVRSPEELGEWRSSAMRSFLADYEQGRREGRYCAAALPDLPFADGRFDLAVCSHFLFYYSDQLPEDFHRKAVGEMLRVAPEVRIFPLVDLNGRVSRYRDILAADLQENGFSVEIVTVHYEFIRGGNRMMRIVRKD